MAETKVPPQHKITKELLEDLYINQKLSVRECAEVLGLPTHGGISWRLKKYGIRARPGGFQKDNKFASGRHGEKASGWKGGKTKKNCVDCGLEFQVFPSQDRAFVRCPDCRGKGRWGKEGRHTYIGCAWCGKQKKVKLSEIRNNKTGFFYCNQKCYGEWLSINRTGEKNGEPFNNSTTCR